MSRIDQVSITPTVARQTPKNEFGEVLKNTLQQGANALGMVSGALLQGAPGGGVVSAAVSSVANFVNQAPTRSSTSAASSGVVNINSGSTVPPGGGSIDAGINAAAGGDMAGMMSTMRAEANRSMAMQMAMQQESREYNTITNVLKVRHDSAKAAINNIR